VRYALEPRGKDHNSGKEELKQIPINCENSSEAGRKCSIQKELARLYCENSELKVGLLEK